jgi:hypothetical protein
MRAGERAAAIGGKLGLAVAPGQIRLVPKLI